MRSHLHYNSDKDLWSLEMKLPRHMAPVTLGFVLWYPGESASCQQGGMHECCSEV
jgi:hypothetical protein